MQPGNADTVAFLGALTAAADGRDNASAFMAGDEGRRGLYRPVAFYGVQIGMTDTAGFYFYEDLAFAWIQRETGGAHGVLVTAVSTGAFRQAIDMLRRGTCCLVGLPPGDFPAPIFDVVLKGLTIRGSIVGTRNDIAESLAFAADGKVKAHYDVEPLENVNSIFERMKKGHIQGRIVMTVN